MPAESLQRAGVNLTFRDARVGEAIGVVCELANLAVVIADETTVVIQSK